MEASVLRSSSPSEANVPAPRILPFFALAWGVTWTLAVPVVSAFMRREAPGPLAVACAGLSAFGPLFAAVVLSVGRTPLREVFGHWRASAGWVLLSLAAPLLIHAVTTGLYAALVGHPSQWFHPPAKPEQLAALVVFPLAEEFGWRGFAHPRMVRRFGLVRGSLLLGAGWGFWHLAYSFTPEAAGFDPITFAILMAQLPLYSLLIAWVFERTHRSMAVAIAFHAGAHLDHLELAPRSELGLQVIHVLVVGCIALVAARALARQERARNTA